MKKFYRPLRMLIYAAAGCLFGLLTIVLSEYAEEQGLFPAIASIIISFNSGAALVGYKLGLPLGTTLSKYLPPLTYWGLIGLLIGLPKKFFWRIVVFIGTLLFSLIIFLLTEIFFHP